MFLFLFSFLFGSVREYFLTFVNLPFLKKFGWEIDKHGTLILKMLKNKYEKLYRQRNEISVKYKLIHSNWKLKKI